MNQMLHIVKISGMLEQGVLYPSQVVDKFVFAGYKLLRDVNGNPAAVLEVRFPRDIYNQGISTLNYLFSTLLVLVLDCSPGFLFLIGSNVLQTNHGIES